jgi:dTDP-L-rhamnose 4-epimerase
MKTVLITGGAGFIGTHLCESLFRKGYKITVFDKLSPQIHGENASVPVYIKDKVNFVKGDVTDREAFKQVIQHTDYIIHLAAETGVGQSMYEIERYTSGIIQGTSVLWDILANEKHHVKKVLLSSSRAVYGEGKYHCNKCDKDIYPNGRTEENLLAGDWGLHCPECDGALDPVPTDEGSTLKTTSIYAICKKTQEELFMVMGKALRIPSTIVRYQNVYGPRQSLNNPYTGILSIFSSRLKNGKSIQIYEDGNECRDFVHVKDAVQGTVLALEKKEADFEVFNIANGVRTSVFEIAEILSNELNPKLKPLITGKFRVGDIRHCFADISKAERLLGYSPDYSIASGLKDFLSWAKNEEANDFSEIAEEELKKKGMLK